ncbi:kinase-like domain-containing protein [Mycena rosella]|uniref:Kinase-like domain-containing protein n=1 Tax=Mycena rosella TaxID=1033263 RepID=A0AAD7DXT1_MYCRO|nr:kinase-like domain-containing protein [Mycena rosella]
MVSATDTFGGPADPDSPEEEEGEYEYGYEFPDEDEFAEGYAAVESPRDGAYDSPRSGGLGSPLGAFGGGASPQRSPRTEDEEEEEEDDEEGTLGPKERAALALAAGGDAPARPTVITTRAARAQLSPGPLTALGLAQTPVTPAQRYAGWVAAAVAPLEDFIDEPVDPRDFYCDLQEIAEGESGSVYSATLIPTAPLYRLRLPPLVHARDVDDVEHGRPALVAIKHVALLPGGSQKLVDVQRECQLLRGLWCEQVLGMDALYVDLVEDTLWIRMELMERSLADVVGLVEEGLRLQEPRIMARFASDMLHALDYLQKHNIAHRDLRSDNLLLNSEGVLKLTDFSNALLVTPETPLSTDPVGVVYWQAPEVRSGAYDPLKIDVWSVGATVWELAEAAPPFSDTQQPAERWPPVSDPALYAPAFHEFLRQCSEPAASRPTPGALLQTPFLQKACGRPVIMQLLARCMAIEHALQAGDAQPTTPS